MRQPRPSQPSPLPLCPRRPLPASQPRLLTQRPRVRLLLPRVLFLLLVPRVLFLLLVPQVLFLLLVPRVRLRRQVSQVQVHPLHRCRVKGEQTNRGSSPLQGSPAPRPQFRLHLYRPLRHPPPARIPLLSALPSPTA